jgi:uncharacterized protein (UPF0276 family)
MEIAVNYSHATAELLREGRIEIDRFKCPAWPDLVGHAQSLHPVYVHFPLVVGGGGGNAIDVESHTPANWRKVEGLMAQTGTPVVNLHLGPHPKDHPGIPANTEDPAQIEYVTGKTVEDVHAVVRRFGPERVIVENHGGGRGRILPPAYLPAAIRRVVEETGCGFLLDISHARLAADYLGLDQRDYIEMLPVEHCREIHITGIRRFEGRWLEKVRQSGAGTQVIADYAGELMDHLPMASADWRFITWAMEQVQGGSWGKPWIATFEVGGVGPLWEAITDKDLLAKQIPRLAGLVRQCDP